MKDSFVIWLLDLGFPLALGMSLCLIVMLVHRSFTERHFTYLAIYAFAMTTPALAIYVSMSMQDKAPIIIQMLPVSFLCLWGLTLWSFCHFILSRRSHIPVRFLVLTPITLASVLASINVVASPGLNWEIMRAVAGLGFAISFVFFGITIKNLIQTIRLADGEENKGQAKWLLGFTSLATLVVVSDFSYMMLFWMGEQPNWLSGVIIALLETVITLFVCFGITRLKPSVQELDVKPLANPSSESQLDAETASLVIEEINRLMEEKKLYENSEFSLLDLTREIGLARCTVSEILNKHMGKSFYEYVNSYRLEQAREKLAEAQDSPRILDIAFSVGFGNKASFNREFKKVFGQTPTQYRQQLCLTTAA